jgi:two-component system chemotaxis response regulator CheB
VAFRIIVMGASLGGTQVLAQILSAIPRDFSFPVAIAQHRGRKIGDGLLPALQYNCSLPVLEPEDKQPIRAGQVFVAPADYHLLVDRNGFVLSKEAPEFHSRPSIDVLFETAADAFFSGVIGVILTGSSRDGARGTARIKALGGVVVVQDPATAENRVMPAAAIESANVDKVLGPGEIGAFLTQLTQTRS